MSLKKGTKAFLLPENQLDQIIFQVEPTDIFESDQFAEQWVDASEFFGGKSASIFQMNDEAPSGFSLI